MFFVFVLILFFQVEKESNSFFKIKESKKALRVCALIYYYYYNNINSFDDDDDDDDGGDDDEDVT